MGTRLIDWNPDPAPGDENYLDDIRSHEARAEKIQKAINEFNKQIEVNKRKSIKRQIDRVWRAALQATDTKSAKKLEEKARALEIRLQKRIERKDGKADDKSADSNNVDDITLLLHDLAEVAEVAEEAINEERQKTAALENEIAFLRAQFQSLAEAVTGLEAGDGIVVEPRIDGGTTVHVEKEPGPHKENNADGGTGGGGPGTGVPYDPETLKNEIWGNVAFGYKIFNKPPDQGVSYVQMNGGWVNETFVSGIKIDFPIGGSLTVNVWLEHDMAAGTIEMKSGILPADTATVKHSSIVVFKFNVATNVVWAYETRRVFNRHFYGIPFPPTSGKHVLFVEDGHVQWIEVGEFACPI